LYSHLNWTIKHKLLSDTFISSAEAWAIYQALILVESSGFKRAAIFFNSRSVLNAFFSLSTKFGSNYLISLIRYKFYSTSNSGYSIYLAWVPSYWGIPGNKKANSLARQTASLGRKLKFRIPFIDFYSRSLRHLKDKFYASLFF